jgi:hypothetical protein
MKLRANRIKDLADLKLSATFDWTDPNRPVELTFKAYSGKGRGEYVPNILYASASDLRQLFDVIGRWKLRRLRCVRVDFEALADNYNLCRYITDACKSLETVQLEGCGTATALVELVHINLPYIRVIHTRMSNSHDTHYPNMFGEYIRCITNCLESNYSLTTFSMCEFDLYMKHCIELADMSYKQITGAKPEIEQENRQKCDRAKSIERKLASFTKRNKAGRKKCRQAIYQLFLIKHYAPENPFKMIDRGVVMIIAKMLHDTTGTKVWST